MGKGSRCRPFSSVILGQFDAHQDILHFSGDENRVESPHFKPPARTILYVDCMAILTSRQKTAKREETLNELCRFSWVRRVEFRRRRDALRVPSSRELSV